MDIAVIESVGGCMLVINPPHAHARRVTVLIFVCQCVCVCVCVCVCHTAVLDDGESPAADTANQALPKHKIKGGPGARL